MQTHLIASVLGVILLTACANTTPQKIEVNRVITEKPKLILPDVPVYKARQVEWVSVTSENVGEVLAKNKTIYVVDANGYRNILHNMADLTSIIEKQRAVIAVYEEN